MTDDLKARLQERLKSRLQAGESGPDVDLMFHRWLTGESWRDMGNQPSGMMLMPPVWTLKQGDGQPLTYTPIEYTTSIDAAYGVIPEGWSYQIGGGKLGNRPFNEVTLLDGEYRYEKVTAPTLPAAILLAVIDARENQ